MLSGQRVDDHSSTEPWTRQNHRPPAASVRQIAVARPAYVTGGASLNPIVPAGSTPACQSTTAWSPNVWGCAVPFPPGEAVSSSNTPTVEGQAYQRVPARS